VIAYNFRGNTSLYLLVKRLGGPQRKMENRRIPASSGNRIPTPSEASDEAVLNVRNIEADVPVARAAYRSCSDGNADQL
jgi:hypothetical protein